MATNRRFTLITCVILALLCVLQLLDTVGATCNNDKCVCQCNDSCQRVSRNCGCVEPCVKSTQDCVGGGCAVTCTRVNGKCNQAGGAVTCTCTSSHGDPHLTGFQGQRFDFQGIRGLPKAHYAFLYDPKTRIWVGATLVSQPQRTLANDGKLLWTTFIQAIGVSVPASTGGGDHRIIVKVGNDSVMAEFENGMRVISSITTDDYELDILERKVVAIKMLNVGFSVTASLAATEPWLNLGFSGPGLSQHTHGVIGQTIHTWYNASGSEEYGNAYGPNGHFSGEPSDYKIEDLFDVTSFERRLPALEMEERVKNRYAAADKYAGVANQHAFADDDKKGGHDDA